MWRTSSGIRTLDGTEALLFASSLLDLIEETKDVNDCDDDYQLGVAPYDNLTYGQRIAVLTTVGNCLLREEVPPLELTAVLEGTIATIFQHLKNCIQFEIDEPEIGTTWRELVVTIRKEMEGEEIPDPTCIDFDEWDIEVECIADYILWDADYSDDKLYMDGEPEKAQHLMQMARISDNYFMAIADDYRDDEIGEKVKELMDLCCDVIKKKMEL
jgi:hypothetical protein